MMHIRIKQYWFNIRNSLWFLPTIMAVSSAVLAFGLIQIDKTITYKNIPIDWFVYGGQRDGARSVLSTIASSMVTIAGVTFSITLVALTMASSQFGPRLLRNFIADKGNQMVIGTFISTFIYSLIVLLTIRGTGDSEFIPKISVVFCFLLAVFSLGVIIYFIHHVTTSIQADYVVKSSFNEFNHIAQRYLLDKKPEEPDVDENTLLMEVRQRHTYVHEICFEESGFIQSIDYDEIFKWATKHAAVVEVSVHPNNFATIFKPFATVYSNEVLKPETVDKIRRYVVLGYQRTPNQDIIFSLKQIVEVGVRALSPGTNDPHTAITCIHWLGAALSIIARRHFASPVMWDDRNFVRVVRKTITYQEIVNTCLDHLILYARQNIFVNAEILGIIELVMPLAHDENLRDVLHQKAAAVHKSMREQHKGTPDLDLVNVLFQRIMNHYSGVEAAP